MSRVIKWTHANGETVEYKGVKALAKALGVAPGTTQNYLNKGIYSDVDLPIIGRPPKRDNDNAIARKRRWPTSVDKHYSDFIAEMEDWE